MGPPPCRVGGQPGAGNRDSERPPLGMANPKVSGAGAGASADFFLSHACCCCCCCLRLLLLVLIVGRGVWYFFARTLRISGRALNAQTYFFFTIVLLEHPRAHHPDKVLHIHYAHPFPSTPLLALHVARGRNKRGKGGTSVNSVKDMGQLMADRVPPDQC